MKSARFFILVSSSTSLCLKRGDESCWLSLLIVILKKFYCFKGFKSKYSIESSISFNKICSFIGPSSIGFLNKNIDFKEYSINFFASSENRLLNFNRSLISLHIISFLIKFSVFVIQIATEFFKISTFSKIFAKWLNESTKFFPFVS